MDKRIFKNSYVILLLSFIILSIIFYFFRIGYIYTIQDGVVVKKFSWRYPLAISLIIWVLWSFVIFPQNKKEKTTKNYANNSPETQKINMMDWR